MSMEYCETCDREIDTDIDASGGHIEHPGNSTDEAPWSEFICGDCLECKIIEHEAREAAIEDYEEAKRRGEL